ncbi:MAG: BatA domain-containing protein [Haloarculaceae archaeon]
MALQDVFLTPLGLAALLIAVPIVLLYLIRPDPSRFELPTYRFLTEEEREQSTTPLFERLSRSLLLLLQLLVILLLAVSLATPYVPVSEREVVEETVLVVDTSASMATETDGTSRFDRAIATAREEITGTTSVVTTVGGGSVILQRGSPGDARNRLDGLGVTDAPGNLRGAIAQAGTLAGENARVVVLSDFAGDDWTDAVSAIRARGLSVALQQFDRGGEGNVGFIDRRFSGAEVTLSVKNFGDEAVTRAVSLGSQQEQVELGPGDVGTVTLAVPAGGGRAELSPGDDFPTDDTAFVAAPENPTVDVLVLTNDRNQFLTTALDVSDQVEVSVESPPTTIEAGYDVIVYSNLDPDSLLPGNVESGRDVLAEGGGVAIQAQSEFPSQYGDLLLIDPTGVDPSPTVRDTEETEITRGIDFQPPDEAITGQLQSGRALVELRDGSPLVATDERDDGRVMYYGYIEDQSSFKYNYQYPVFWKRAAFHLAGRQPLPALNHETGDTVRFGVDTVEGPSGPISGRTADLGAAGFYTTGNARHSASLLDEAESSVGVEPLTERSDAVGETTREETRTVPRPLTEFFAIAVIGAALLEIGYLRRRGDL